MIVYMTMFADRYLLSTRLRIRTIRSANGARTRDYSRYRIRAIDLGAMEIECSSGTPFLGFSDSSVFHPEMRNCENRANCSVIMSAPSKGNLKSKSLCATGLCISHCSNEQLLKWVFGLQNNACM